MQTKSKNKVLFSINEKSILFHALIVLMIIGLLTNFYGEFQKSGFDIYATKHFTVATLIVVAAICWKFKLISAKTVLLTMVYVNLVSSTIFLPLRVADVGLNVEAYFLRVEMIFFVMALILAVFERPWHQLVVVLYNAAYIISLKLLLPSFATSQLVLSFIMVSSVGVVTYFVFNKVIKLRSELERNNKTISIKNNELNELNAFRKDVIRIIAHDLRNPVGQISSLVDIVLMTEDPKEKQQCLVLLKHSVSGAYELLDSLLSWSMQADGELSNYSKLNAFNIIQDSIGHFAYDLERKKIKVLNKVDVAQEINFSRNVLDTVIRNLLSNAIKFSPENEAIILEGNQDNSVFALKVRNKALNINSTLIEKFNEGEKLMSTNGTANEKGTGNGLYICKRMLEKNNSHLELSATDEEVLATVTINTHRLNII